MIGVGATESTDGGDCNTYSLVGSFGATESTDDADDEPIYGLACQTGGGSLQFKSGHLVEPIYEMSSSSSPDDNTVIVPHGAPGSMDQLQRQYEQAAQFLTPDRGAGEPIYEMSSSSSTDDKTAVLGYIGVTLGGNVDCDSADPAGESSLPDSDLDSLPGDLQPGSATAGYMECIMPDGRDSPYATPEPFGGPESTDAPTSLWTESTDAPKSRWMSVAKVAKWMTGRKGKPKRRSHTDHMEVPRPSSEDFQVIAHRNVLLTDDGSPRKTMSTCHSASSLDVDGDGAASDLALVHKAEEATRFLLSLTARASICMEASTITEDDTIDDDLYDDATLLDNVEDVEDDPTGELSSTSPLTMDPQLGIKFKRSSALLLHSNLTDADTVTHEDTDYHSPDEVIDAQTMSSVGLRSSGSQRAGESESDSQLFETSELNPLVAQHWHASSMDTLMQLSDATLASGADLETAMAEALAAEPDYMESLGSEDIEAPPKTMLEGSRTWSFAGSVRRVSKRISRVRKDAKTLNTPTSIRAPIRRRPMPMPLEADAVGTAMGDGYMEADEVDSAMDTGYISNGIADRGSMVTVTTELELELPLPEEDVDAEWKDIHQFLSTVSDGAEIIADHLAPLEDRDPGPMKR